LFEGALGRPVEVVMEQSIVKGDNQCKFRIILWKKATLENLILPQKKERALREISPCVTGSNSALGTLTLAWSCCSSQF